MRDIDYIVLHCTATPQNTSVESIKRYWRENLGWKSPGYHYIVDAAGVRHNLEAIQKPTNGVKGYNSASIHISYIGGIDANGKGKDTRTEAQKKEMECIILELLELLPCRPDILGHKDFPRVAKECPSFDVQKWLKEINL